MSKPMTAYDKIMHEATAYRRDPGNIGVSLTWEEFDVLINRIKMLEEAMKQ